MEVTASECFAINEGELIQSGVARVDGRLVGWGLWSDESPQAFLAPRLELVISDPVEIVQSRARIKAWLKDHADRAGVGPALRLRAAEILWKVRECLLASFPLTIGYPTSHAMLSTVERLQIRLNSERVELEEV